MRIWRVDQVMREPSVTADADSAHAGQAEELVCPDCGGALTTNAGGPRSSRVVCGGCGNPYPIINGVPHFALHLQDQTETAESFGFAWKAFWSGSFDKKSVFGLQTVDIKRHFLDSLGIREPELQGARVLDAGTGSGRIPMARP